MKRIASIKTSDGESSLEIKIVFKSKNKLSRDEVDEIVRRAARKCQRITEELPYTNFYVENTKILV